MKWRWGKWALLVLALLAMPFCWSFGRDSWAIATTTEREDAFELHMHLVSSLLTAETWGTWQTNQRRNPIYTTIVSNPRCYTINRSDLRPNDALGGRPEPNETFPWQLSYVFLNENFFDERVRMFRATRAFTPVEAAALRACIVATPFASMCNQERDTQISNAYQPDEWDRMRAELGVQLRVLNEAGEFTGQYCDAMPSIRE